VIFGQSFFALVGAALALAAGENRARTGGTTEISAARDTNCDAIRFPLSNAVMR
jgi:hypothetical protein